jgi:hypothetical protein
MIKEFPLYTRFLQQILSSFWSIMTLNRLVNGKATKINALYNLLLVVTSSWHNSEKPIPIEISFEQLGDDIVTRRR